MNDIIEALKTRLSSPLLGYFTLALVALNWKSFFYLFVQEGDVLGRISYFESTANIYSLTLWPLLAAIAFATSYPWLLFALAFLTSKPVELRDVLQARAEHKLLAMKKELEEARSKIFAGAELELIERAQRDQQLSEIGSDEIREKLRAELDELRAQRDAIRHSGGVGSIERHNELMRIASTYRARAGEASTSYEDTQTFVRRAQELEDEAHKLLLKDAGA